MSNSKRRWKSSYTEILSNCGKELENFPIDNEMHQKSIAKKQIKIVT